MKPTIAAKLAQLSNRLQEINGLLARESATADLDAYRRLTREHAEITPVVALYERYVSGEEDLKAAEEMARMSARHRQVVIGIVAGLVALLGVGLVMDIAAGPVGGTSIAAGSKK